MVRNAFGAFLGRALPAESSPASRPSASPFSGALAGGRPNGPLPERSSPERSSTEGPSAARSSTAGPSAARPSAEVPSGSPGSAVIVRVARGAAVYPCLEDVARPEYQNAARQDRHLLTGFRIASDTAALLTHGKGSEPTDFNGFSTFKCRADAA